MILSGYNKLFNITLKKIKLIKKIDYKVDLKETLGFIRKNFTEYEDCIFFTNKVKLQKNIWKEYNNRTQFEAFENHIHMSDFILNEHGLILLDFGLAIAKVLSLKLNSVFPRYKFRIIISYDITNKFGNYNDCVIRFHKLRSGEKWLANNLEDYKEDAVGYFDV